MKVICIDATQDPDSPLPIDVSEGEIYTVIDEGTDTYGRWYAFAERGWDNLYSADCFIPVSDIDETEFIRETNTQYA